jgi:small subunit ribosomal protein S9
MIEEPESPQTPEEPPAEEPTPAAEEQAPAAEEPTPAAEEQAPAAEEPTPAAEEPTPVAEQPAAEEQPVAEQPPAEQPVAEAADEDAEEDEPAPREKPEIPGADLEVDIVLEGDALAPGAVEEGVEEPEVEGEPGEEPEPGPIAQATIDLAAGARYTATGKRKTAVARVILKPGDGSYRINGRELDTFFPRATLQRNIRQPLETVGYESRMDVVAKLHGGGVSAQAGALRHGISRALIEADPNLRAELKRRGFLTRDSRAKERKKAGLKKARKRPQFSKR